MDIITLDALDAMANYDEYLKQMYIHEVKFDNAMGLKKVKSNPETCAIYLDEIEKLSKPAKEIFEAIMLSEVIEKEVLSEKRGMINQKKLRRFIKRVIAKHKKTSPNNNIKKVRRELYHIGGFIYG